MALVVDPKDIVTNQKVVEKMQKEFGDAVKLRESVLKAFEARLKALEGAVKTMEGAVQSGRERVKYHLDLKKEIELRLAGKRKASLESADDTRVKFFIDVVEKEEWPKFEKALQEFEGALEDIKKSLK